MKVSSRHRVFSNCSVACITDTDESVFVDLGDGTPTEIAVGTKFRYEDDNGSPISVSFEDLPVEHIEAIVEAYCKHEDMVSAMVDRQGKTIN